jgi:Phytanoyl-CoA dioxygenase (PhyH)
MGLETVARNAREVAVIVRSDLRSDLTRRRGAKPELAPSEARLVDELRVDGYVVIREYWPRSQALELRDRLEGLLAGGKSRDFPSGAYVRFRDNVAYDEGVRRIYHVDKEFPELGVYRDDPMIRRVVAAYYGRPFHSGTLMYQYNTKSNANTRYHHVDAFSQEFKSFLYLDDVDDGNGPFAYIPGSQRAHLKRIAKQLRHGSAATGFTDVELGGAIEREVKLTGDAGTLILADVRGFHRGTPQLNRSRSALVNYLYATPGEVELER